MSEPPSSKMAPRVASDVPFKRLAWMQLAGYTAIALGAALVLAAIVHGPKDATLVRALETRPLLAWGRASYSAYLWHLVFFPSVVAFVARHANDARTQFLAASAISIAFTIAAAFASYRLLEVRVLAPHPEARAR